MNNSPLEQEGDAWHLRRLGISEDFTRDPVLEEIRQWANKDCLTSVLEIGCSYGHRLGSLASEFGATCTGVDSSKAAIESETVVGPRLIQGVAPDCLAQFRDGEFDLIILGFFQYLLPRHEIFRLSFEVDRMLKQGGRLVACDFLVNVPMSRAYAHRGDLRVYKGVPSAPWSWSPDYQLVGRRIFDHYSQGSHGSDPDEWVTVDTLLKLSESVAYPKRRGPH